MHRRQIIITASILYTLALALRWYRIGDRVWFNGDASKELLYAWNIVRDHKPLFISMMASGTSFRNLPLYINFLAFLTWVCGSNPVRVVYAVNALTATAVPLLFLWGTIDSGWLTGLIAATAFMISPAALEMSNVWGNLIAFIPAVFGIAVWRYARAAKSDRLRGIALVSLCIAGALHYSHIGLMIAILAVEYLPKPNVRRLLGDMAICIGTLTAAFLPTVIALIANHWPVIPEIIYTDMCRFCPAKIPTLVGVLGTWFLTQYHGYRLSLMWLVLLATAAIGIVRYRHLTAWTYAVVTAFLVVCWIFVGQAAFWYLFPVLPFAYVAFGQIHAQTLRSGSRPLRIGSVATLVLFVWATIPALSQCYGPTDQVQAAITAAQSIRNTAAVLGISRQNEVEYVNLDPAAPQPFPETTAIWLVRQWLFGDRLTYNNPLTSYDPVLTDPYPQYRIVAQTGCTKPLLTQLPWTETDGYAYVQTVCVKQSDLSIQLYRKSDTRQGADPHP
jgi:hypothetical protein